MPEHSAKDFRPVVNASAGAEIIDQWADVSMLLYRDEVFNKATDEQNILEVRIVKNCLGELATIKLRRNSRTGFFQCCRFEVDREYFETDDRIKELGKHARDCLQTQDEQCSEHDLQATLDEWVLWNSSPEYKWKGLNTILLSTWEAGTTKAMCMAIHSAYHFLQELEWLHKKGEWQQTAEYFYGLRQPKLSNLTLSELAQIAGSWVVIDVETTGFSANSERIIRIEAIRFELGKAVAGFSTFVNPSFEISHEVETITGISKHEISGGKTFTAAFAEFSAFVANTVVVSHNAQLSNEFLAAECARNNLPAPNFDSVCTYEIAKSKFPHIRNSIDSLINHLNIDTRQFGEAPSDIDCSPNFWRDAHVVRFLLEAESNYENSSRSNGIHGFW